MAPRYTLYGVQGSGPAYKVALMLKLAGEPFAYRHVNMRGGENKTPDYLAKNRFGQVPALVDEQSGLSLCQSAAILEYLADKTGKFGGATLEERLRIREWMFWEFDRLAVNIYRPRAVKVGYRQMAPEAVAELVTAAHVALKVLDDALAGRNWVVGEGMTIADIDLFGVVVYARQAEIDLSAYRNIGAWLARIEALPGFAQPQELMPLPEAVS